MKDIKNSKNHVDSQNLIDNWQQVNEQVAQACEHAEKQAESVTLLAVSKTKPADMIAILAQQGQRHFGENYLQEAIEKITTLKEQSEGEAIVWHYIGSIQRNKTRDIAEHFDWVQTVERDIIAKRLNDQRPAEMPPLNVLIQVNIDDEDSKSGCLPTQLPELITVVKGYERLTLRGLMIIPAKADTDAFERTKQLFDDIKHAHPELNGWDTLSMGMSGDMGEAIVNGSTMVRVGTAIFGARAL
ncbi:YggS family pyridoxal phosphate-dependent enzyme [Psychrobacter sp. AOP22-C1-22]|uniref:YggS family pyridoxal phosphate-dependent enzyme n=1 Tax=unclassified Psychrobacter TaxID=196806 RepID=UPI00178897F7|nr:MULTISPECIES: YggS family pyridoxal phosphate-dependent enzyme [unclassified Psychrobacter]MBE0407591.1 YggS family pyridoxal phosphate-dependent enzyme [Psychrobacter sp. FME6]MBE0445848.1 YggS family pyridoxal phosphate-dependent enzyme [Psychrobacter sp. FME5]MDN5802020.1 YggS family pyridoxal phosphate-dependent enzyme [Psychrobacter sp.]MDN5898371.1 YggS family pyridoxal phosphate-dependent enzyme [Psychrobacter sp.]